MKNKFLQSSILEWSIAQEHEENEKQCKSPTIKSLILNKCWEITEWSKNKS